ncbi:MAG: hypothetical protein ACRECO_17650 [Xanthobacteraceae bacterium]
MQKPIIATFAFLALTVTAQAQPTPAQRQACEQDAYRLCERAIPDENKVRRCLAANMRRLSPVCRSAFKRGKARKRRR